MTELKTILTVDDLMLRWGVSRDTVLAHVDNAEHPLPYLLLAPQSGSRKNRTLLRFRLAAVEEWERAGERRTIAPLPVESTPTGSKKPVGGKTPSYTGKIHTIVRKAIKTK